MEVKDDGTREMLASILDDEEGHLDRLEAQVEQTGIRNCLVKQTSQRSAKGSKGRSSGRPICVGDEDRPALGSGPV